MADFDAVFTVSSWWLGNVSGPAQRVWQYTYSLQEAPLKLTKSMNIRLAHSLPFSSA